MLVGNKTDLKHLRSVKCEDGAYFAEQNSISFIEASALDCWNVETTFEALLRQVYHAMASGFESNTKAVAEVASGESLVLTTSNRKNKTCC